MNIFATHWEHKVDNVQTDREDEHDFSKKAEGILRENFWYLLIFSNFLIFKRLRKKGQFFSKNNILY
jgi:hypothetical protein